MGRKLTIFMLDGTVTGPKTIEIGNWSGKAIYCPRAFLKNLLIRGEFDSPGVYLLQSQSESYEFDGNVYIGEAEELRARLKQHISDRDFESVVCFLSKDELLTKAHIKYLESKLVGIAREANNFLVENSATPRTPRLSEADISDMEYFIEQIRLILPAVGINTLVAAAPHAEPSQPSMVGDKEYRVNSKTLQATMVELDGAFVVRKGSRASATTSPSIAAGWLKIRKKLLDAGVLISRDDQLIFTEDAVFSSPSAASSVVLGRQAPGPISWIDEKGRTYKEVQRQLQTG